MLWYYVNIQKQGIHFFLRILIEFSQKIKSIISGCFHPLGSSGSNQCINKTGCVMDLLDSLC